MLKILFNVKLFQRLKQTKLKKKKYSADLLLIVSKEKQNIFLKQMPEAEAKTGAAVAAGWGCSLV